MSVTQPGLVAAARQAGVVALPRKALGDVAADAGASAKDEADGLGHDRVLQREGPAAPGSLTTSGEASVVWN